MDTTDTSTHHQDDVFARNTRAMQEQIDALDKELKRIHAGGPSKARERQQSLGKMLARERIDYLIDDGQRFFELSALAGYQLYEDSLPCGGIITGIGAIHGTPCMIIANDASVKGGTYYPITIKKHLRAQEIAHQLRLPCIYLVDSGGAFLPMQDEVFPDRDHFGRIFYNQARMSADNIPQIAVVLGSCTAGGAYVPAMADIAIMVKHQATIFLGGPPLVKAATGETISAEELGGADLHCKTSGVADYYADNDQDALDRAITAVKHSQPTPADPPASQPDYLEPSVSAESMLGMIHTDARIPTPIHNIIAALVDNSEFDEFKALFGSTLVCGFARIQGELVGIVANNGVLFSESAQKGTQFILLCNQRRIPLLFLQNITGFMVGQKAESDGIAKHGAKMVNAVACSNVPKITIIIGGSYGAGNYAMAGRAYNPHFLFMWPNAKIAVMGGKQAAEVLNQVKAAQMARRGKPSDEQHQQSYKQRIESQYQERSHAFYASARLWDDGVINPLDTRHILGFTLRLCKKTISPSPPQYGVFRM